MSSSSSNKCTATLVCNNLTMDALSIAFAHQGEIMISSLPIPSGSASHEPWKKLNADAKEAIMQLRLCNIGGIRFLIAASQKIIQVFDPVEGNKIFTYAIPPASDREIFGSGIASSSNTKYSNALFVGTSNGVCVFSVDRFKIYCEETLCDGNKGAIVDIASHDETRSSIGGHIAIGDLAGSVVVRNVRDLSIISAFHNESQQACTSVRIRDDLAYAAFVTGHIRIFNWKKSHILAEIASHSRSITAMDMHPSRDILASVSEDTFLVIWDLSQISEKRVTSLLAVSAEDCLLTGVKFSSQGDQIHATAYDRDTILTWDTPR